MDTDFNWSDFDWFDFNSRYIGLHFDRPSPHLPLEANHPMFRSGALTVLTVPLTVWTGEGILVRDGVTGVGHEAGASLI